MEILYYTVLLLGIEFCFNRRFLFHFKNGAPLIAVLFMLRP